MFFPLNVQLGPKGYGLLSLQLAAISPSSPTHSANGSKPVCQSCQNDWAANITAHITGSPFSAVKPSTVKCASLAAAHCWGRPSMLHRYSWPPTCPSFVWVVFEPHSSTKWVNQGESVLILMLTQMHYLLTLWLHHFCFSTVVQGALFVLTKCLFFLQKLPPVADT